MAVNSSERTTVPLKSAMDHGTSQLKQLKDVARFLDISAFQSELANLKSPHPTIKGRYLIDFDSFFETLLIAKHRYFKARFEVIFKALDVENQECIGVDQFIILFNLFEKKKFPLRRLLKIYSKYVDLVDEDENRNFMTFKQFAICAETEGLLRPDKIAAFTSDTRDQITDLQSLEIEWCLKKNIIRLKLIRARCYSLYFQKMLSSIDYFFPLDAQDPDCEMTWLRYRILDSYSNHLLIENITSSFIPMELEEINSLYKKFEE